MSATLKIKEARYAKVDVAVEGYEKLYKLYKNLYELYRFEVDNRDYLINAGNISKKSAIMYMNKNIGKLQSLIDDIITSYEDSYPKSQIKKLLDIRNRASNLNNFDSLTPFME